ncbi:hypothetical protein [Nitrogeniibacter aestuarii]|uniref:hypothetical protein n=1 Tax=Nitrogeniibacter aestuarii TaxID=2815343 RepID=UPI001E5277E3|nr:hypothetical protein [Nitrogeniibacter aestuarii]
MDKNALTVQLAGVAISFVCCLPFPSWAGSNIAAVLFDAGSGLSGEDKQEVSESLPLTLRRGRIESSMPECANQPANPKVKVISLDSDIPVVVVQGGNACTSGMTGQSVWIVAKTNSKWRLVMDVPALFQGLHFASVHAYPSVYLSGRSHCDRNVWAYSKDPGQYEYQGSFFQDGSPCTP